MRRFLKYLWSLRKILVVIASAIILTSLGIKASDRFLTASLQDSMLQGPCPSDMVFVDSSTGGLCVDKYENAPGSGCPYQVPNNETETNANIDNPKCVPVSKASVIPWSNITQNQARLACNKAGKRLPDNKEWFQAALGTPDEESGWGAHDCHVNNNWDLQPGLAGSAEKCVSSAGAYDMIGNVWEWVDGTIFDGSYQNHELPEQGFVQDVDSEGLAYMTDFDNASGSYHKDYFWIRSQGARGMARGGYWNNQSDAGIYSVYLAVPPSFSGVGVGFRCVK